MTAFDFSAIRVLVVGDVILDEYFHGVASRISPEAPVPVVLVNKVSLRLGGAANVALNLKSLGASVSVQGVTGEDVAAEQLKKLLSAAGIDYRFINALGKKTIQKLRVLSAHHQMLRLDQEASLCLDGLEEGKHFIEDFEQALAHHDIVVLSDYAKGTLAGLHQDLIQRAHAYRRQVVVDPKSKTPDDYRGADIVTPNLKEFEVWVGPCPSLDILESKAKHILQAYEIGCLVLTRSEAGISVIRPNVPAIHIAAQAKEVCDVTGAGDTVVAVLAAGVASGQSMECAVKLANMAAGIVVGKLGTATVTAQELYQQMVAELTIKRGILHEAELLQQVAAAKARGEIIVFTNGCFDLLHAGHVSYLNEAKALGTYLIVAVNTDSTVKKLKGQNRPITPLADRMFLLSNLQAVDWVIPFAEDTPAALIEKINPDIMVKGGDYQDIEALAGAPYVLSRGGKVQILSLKPGRSTTHIVQKIQETAENVLP